MTAVTLCLLLLSATTPDEIIKAAEPIRKLESFMESYVGECNKGDADDQKSCKENAAAFRKTANSKTFVADLASEVLRSMRPARSKDNDKVSYDFTPFFDAGGYGVTFGKPIGQDKNGDPKIRSSTLTIPVTENGESAILDGMKVDRVTVSLVFKPVELWKLPKRGPKGSFWYGLSVKPVLLRLQENRSGSTADTIFK